MIVTVSRVILRSILWLDLLLATLVLYSLAWLPKFLTRSWYSKLFRKWCWVFIRAMDINLKLHQKNIRPIPKQYILIGNHPSAFEDVGMNALFDVRFLGKIEIRKWFILGRISDHAGTQYVKRDCKDSRKEAGIALTKALEKGLNIGVYPEGGCKGRRINLPFNYGIFDIAIKTNTPILPVFLHYEAQEDFEWGPVTLVRQILTMSYSINRNVNFYVYDAILPQMFSDKEELTKHVQNLYLKWQSQYLE